MKKPVMGIQLYTLRDFIQTADDFDSTLERLGKLGVKDVQISAIGEFPAKEQGEILRKHGMTCCVTHKQFERMLTDLDAMIDDHREIGCDAMGIGAAPENSRYSSTNVRNFINHAQQIGAALKKAGMTFNYHNHDFEFHKLNDKNYSMMDMLLNETDPDLFHFIPDLAWIHYAGSDPVEILGKMKGRVKVAHFKDYIFDENNSRKFVSLGKGRVNLRECYETACELEIPYIVYEQDCDWVDGDPFWSTEESWAFMQELIK